MNPPAGPTCHSGAGDQARARPLSRPLQDLLEHGDTGGRYQSRSEAVMAIAVAAVNAGWDEETWRHMLTHHSPLGEWASIQHRKTGARRPRRPADTEHRLRTVWAKAVSWVSQRPRAGDAPSVIAELAAITTTADHNPTLWKGAAGVTDRAVLAELVAIAATALTLTPSASVRQLSEAANIAPVTASVALRRLQTKGWLRRENPSTGVKAAVWRLLRPEDLPGPAGPVQEILEALPPRPVQLVHTSTRAHDAFAHTIHGGLGRVASRLFDVLGDYDQAAGLTTDQLRALTGLHRRTISRHLAALASAGLALRHGRTWTRSSHASSRRHEALDHAAGRLGTAGNNTARRARNQAQRDAFITWYTDFSARSGWAVQRGLYRPDQPQLPLAHAS